jgi:hypothetical protein
LSYFYVVKAANVASVATALGTTTLEVFDRIRDLRAPHGYTAWKAWLFDHAIPYEFSVWR